MLIYLVGEYQIKFRSNYLQVNFLSSNFPSCYLQLSLVLTDGVVLNKIMARGSDNG